MIVQFAPSFNISLLGSFGQGVAWNYQQIKIFIPSGAFNFYMKRLIIQEFVKTEFGTWKNCSWLFVPRRIGNWKCELWGNGIMKNKWDILAARLLKCVTLSWGLKVSRILKQVIEEGQFFVLKQSYVIIILLFSRKNNNWQIPAVPQTVLLFIRSKSLD